MSSVTRTLDNLEWFSYTDSRIHVRKLILLTHSLLIFPCWSFTICSCTFTHFYTICFCTFTYFYTICFCTFTHFCAICFCTFTQFYTLFCFCTSTHFYTTCFCNFTHFYTICFAISHFFTITFLQFHIFLHNLFFQFHSFVHNLFLQFGTVLLPVELLMKRKNTTTANICDSCLISLTCETVCGVFSLNQHWKAHLLAVEGDTLHRHTCEWTLILLNQVPPTFIF